MEASEVKQIDSDADAEYHGSPGVSCSRLKDFMRDPRLYHHKWLSGKYVRESAPHFDFGSAVHEICLLGSQANIAVIPSDVLAKNGARSGGAWKEWSAENSGKMQLKQHDFDAVLRCVESIGKHPVASKLLSAAGECEVPRVYEHPVFDLTLKCKPDKYIPSTGMIVDLKTTSAGTQPGAFAKHVGNFGYHHQEYFYRSVMELVGEPVHSFVFVVVDIGEPHTVDCYTLDSQFLEIAEADVESALSDLAERTRADFWEPYSHNSIVELSPPNYLKYRGDYQL